jgi:hypothetical protein
MNRMPKATTGNEPISCRGALMSTLLHANVYVFTQFAECTCTDCKQNRITENMNGGIWFQCPSVQSSEETTVWWDRDPKLRSQYAPADATPARSREVLVVRTLGTLDGDGWSEVLLLFPLPLPLLSSPFLTGVAVALRVMKRRCGVTGKPPALSREPYWDAICCRRSSLYRAIRSARRRCESTEPSHEPEVAVPSRARAFDGEDVLRSLRMKCWPL